MQELLAAVIIKEIDFPEWLANPVMVSKLEGDWHICINFTDLNKNIPKK